MGIGARGEGDVLGIAVHGAAGRMGSRVVAIAREEKDIAIVAALGRPGDPRVGRDVGLVAGVGPLEVPFGDRLPAEGGGVRVDAVIDFSEPVASLAIARTCVERRIPLVVATTGFSREARAELEATAATIPLLLEANLSLGVALLTRLVRDSARALGIEADVEIVEAHHRKKMDAPSGTALHLARAVAEGRRQELERETIYGRHGVSAERRHGEIAVHALRLGDVVGEHTVAFGFGSERIEHTHRAHTRDVFARGALRAARFVATAPPGLYGAEDMLGLRR